MEKATRYILETLSPLHIGSGDRIYPVEYVLTGNEFIRVDMDSLFQEPTFNCERYISEAKVRGFYLGKFDKNNALKYPLYKLTLDSNASTVLINKISTPNAQILEFIKDANGFFIPGSSIKGAIRTTLLWFLLRNKSNLSKYESGLKNNLNSKNSSNKESFSVKAEQSLLGEPNYDLMRTVHFGDSESIPPNSMSVEVSYVLSKKNGSYSWKQLGGQGGNTNNLSEATPIFFEALKPGMKVSGSFKVDEFLLDEDIAKIFNWKLIDYFDQITGGKGRENYLNNIVKTCNSFALYHLEREIEFFNQIGLVEVKNTLEKIKNTHLAKNELLLHLSWGSGYEAKALGNTIGSELFTDIRNYFRIGRTNASFPKTRKVVFRSGNPLISPGWVKLRFL